MFDEELGEGAQVNTSDLNEELGQVQRGKFAGGLAILETFPHPDFSVLPGGVRVY